MVQISLAYLLLHQYEKALEWARESLRQPHIRWSRWMVLIASLGHLGRLEEASEAVKSLHRFNPKIDLNFLENGVVMSHKPSLDHLMEGLRKAGMTA